MKFLFTGLIKSNIFISLAAAVLAFGTQVQLGFAPHFHPYIWLIFFAALFEYNLHRLVTVLTNKAALNSVKHRWVKDYPYVFYFLVLVSVAGFATTLLYAKIEVLISLIPAAVLTIFYSVPVFKFSDRLYRLREIPFIKIFLIAFVWSVVTIILPVIESGYNGSLANLSFVLAERYVFIFAITIPFDIRDMEQDKRYNLKTIPIVYGVNKSYKISNAALVIFILICLIHYISNDELFILLAMIVSGISTLAILNSKTLRTHFYYHYGWLDGTMLAQGMLICLSYYIFY